MIELRNKSNYNQNNNSIFLTQYNEENNLVIIIGLTDGIIRQNRDINIPLWVNEIGTAPYSFVTVLDSVLIGISLVFSVVRLDIINNGLLNIIN